MGYSNNAVIASMLWASVERVGSQVVRFLVGLVLARLLFPADYGIIAVLTVFIAIADILIDSGFSDALIQKDNRTEADYSTVFYFNLLISIALYVLLFVLSPLVADFYSMPLLAEISKVYFICILINSLRSVHETKLRIELKFKLQARISIISALLSGGIGIACAVRGMGVWALVVQSLVYSILSTTMIWISTQWHPSLLFSSESFHSMFSFGSKLLSAKLLDTLIRNSYTLFIGKFCTSADVGYYNRATSLSDFPVNMTKSILVKVNYPILVKYKDDDQRLKSEYSKMLRTPMYLLFPLMVMMSALAKPIIILVLGENWLPCYPMIMVLTLGYMWHPLSSINLNLLYVKGRSDLVLRLEYIKKPLLLALLFLGLPFGIFWIAVGRSLYSVLVFFINCYYTNDIMSYGWREQMSDVGPLFVYSTVCFIASYMSSQLFGNPIIQIIIGLFAGFLSYILFSAYSKDPSWKYICNFVKKIKNDT